MNNEHSTIIKELIESHDCFIKDALNKHHQREEWAAASDDDYNNLSLAIPHSIHVYSIEFLERVRQIAIAMNAPSEKEEKSGKTYVKEPIT